jgi:hypothetical protein
MRQVRARRHRGLGAGSCADPGLRLAMHSRHPRLRSLPVTLRIMVLGDGEGMGHSTRVELVNALKGVE